MSINSTYHGSTRRSERGTGLLLLVFIMLIIGGLSIEMTRRFAGARQAQRLAEAARAEHLLRANAQLLAEVAEAQGIETLEYIDERSTTTLRRESGQWEVKAAGLHPLAIIEGGFEIQKEEENN